MSQDDTQTTTGKKPDLIAYTVTQSGEKSYFQRIGAAWSNSKGGSKVILEALPVNGEILLMPPKAQDEESA